MWRSPSDTGYHTIQNIFGRDVGSATLSGSDRSWVTDVRGRRPPMAALPTATTFQPFRLDHPRVAPTLRPRRKTVGRVLPVVPARRNIKTVNARRPKRYAKTETTLALRSGSECGKDMAAFVRNVDRINILNLTISFQWQGAVATPMQTSNCHVENATLRNRITFDWSAWSLKLKESAA